MPIKKHLLFFLLKFAIAYGILMLPPLRTLYGDAFRGIGNKWFRYVDEKGVTIFRANESGEEADIIAEIRLMNKERLAEAKAKGIKIIYDYGKVYCNWFGYLLVAYLIALIAATPISWKRKGLAFLAGMVIAFFYYLLMIWVLLVFKFDQNPQLQVLHLDGLKKKLIYALYPVLVGNPGTTVVIALIIYVLVVFRREDLDKVRGVLVSI